MTDEDVSNKEKVVKKVAKKTNKKEKDTPKLIDLPGVGPGAVAKLEAAGIYELMGLAVLTPAGLSDMAGMSEAVARKAIQAARKMMEMGFISGLEHEEKRRELFNITTGSDGWTNVTNITDYVNVAGIRYCPIPCAKTSKLLSPPNKKLPIDSSTPLKRSPKICCNAPAIGPNASVDPKVLIPFNTPSNIAPSTPSMASGRVIESTAPVLTIEVTSPVRFAFKRRISR